MDVDQAAATDDGERRYDHAAVEGNPTEAGVTPGEASRVGSTDEVGGARSAARVRRFVCRLIGHVWTQGYREPDGYPLGVCSRCGLTEQWAGGMLVTSSDWRESDRLNAKEAS